MEKIINFVKKEKDLTWEDLIAQTQDVTKLLEGLAFPFDNWNEIMERMKNLSKLERN